MMKYFGSRVKMVMGNWSPPTPGNDSVNYTRFWFAKDVLGMDDADAARTTKAYEYASKCGGFTNVTVLKAKREKVEVLFTR
jgi:hypothetical protein